MDKLQVGEVYTEEGSREVRAIRRWTENTVDFKIIRLLQREVPLDEVFPLGRLPLCLNFANTLFLDERL